MENNFMLELIGALDKSSSTKQINSDIKELRKSINMLRLTASLMKGDTKKSINQVIQQMEGQLNHVKLKTKIDQKNLKSDIDKALNRVSFKDIDAINIDENKVKLKAKKVIADVKKTVQNSPISLNVDLKKEKLSNDLTAYLSKNSRIRESEPLLKEADKLREKIASINDKDSLRNITQEFQLFKSEASATGYAMKSTSEKIRGLLGNATKIGSTFGVASMAISNYQKSLQTIKKNNDIITEISKTSNSTKQELEELGKSAFDTASKFGKVSSDYLAATKEMNRSGFYGETGKALGELTLLTQAAGDVSAETAQKYLLSTNAAYRYAGNVEKLNGVLDGQNTITNKWSVDMETMATATEKAGSMAANTGIKINELSAMIGTISARTKEAGTVTGTGIKALLVNLQNISSDKITGTLDKANASMTETVDGVEKLRTPIAILKDLAKTYNSLNENDPLKSEITTNIGGKHHANQLSALLCGWADYEKMLVDYSNGTGSALEEANKSANNLTGRLNALQNSWDSLVDSMTNKSLIKDGISFFNGILQSAEKLIGVFDVFPVAIAGLTAGMVALNKDYGLHIFDNEGNFELSGNLLGIDFTAIKQQKQHFKNASEAIDGWNQKLVNGITDIESFENATVKNNNSLREYLSTCSVDAPASLEGYKNHLQKAGVATNSLRIGTILLNTALSAGIAFAIQGITTAIIDFATASNKIQEKAKEIGSSINNTKSDIENYKTKIKELQDTIHDSSSSILDITEARKNLMSIQSELIEKYGSETETINIVTDAINDQADALDRLSEKSYKEEKNKFNKSGFVENLSNNINGYSSNMDRMISEMETPLILNLTQAGNRNIEEYKKFEKIISQYGTIGTGSKSLGGNGVEAFTIELSGGLDSVYEKLLKIQETASNYDFGSNDFNKMLTNKINETKEKLDKYSELYDNYVLYDKILSNSGKTNGYDKVFKSLIDSYNKYMDVITSGDEAKIEQAQNDYAELFTESMKQIDDESVIAYFENMYPELQEEIGAWQFKIHFSSNVENIQKDIKDVMEKLNKDGFTVESLVDFQSETATDEQIQNYNMLDSVATKYNMTVADLIELLEKMGLVQNESYKQLVSQFGEDNVKTLSDKDLQIAYTIKSSGEMNFEQFKEEIEKINANTKLQTDYSTSIQELETSIFSLTDTEELLNTALSEQAEKGTISEDTLVSLRDKYSDLSKVLEITANGVIINKDKLSELNAEEKKSVNKNLASTREKLVDQYNANSLAIAGYRMQLEDTNSMTDKQKSALEALLSVKESDQRQTSEQIAQLDLLGVQYDTLTSKTNKFLQSLSTADDGSVYDSVQSALEQVKEVYDEGDYGKDEFRNFVDYMSSEDMSTASIDEVKSHYKEAMKTAERYFKENNKGVKNFVNDLKKFKMASQDADGSWTLNIGDIDKASKKLGISSDAMTDILNKLKDKGWEIDFTTADNDLVDVNSELNKLEKRLDKLKEKKVKLKADGKSTEEVEQKISTVEKSIEGIKSEIQLSIDTEDAKTKILEYQSKINELNKQPPTQEDMSSIANYKKKQKELADKYKIDLNALLSVDTSKADKKIKDTKEKSKKDTTFEVDADTKKAVEKIDKIFNKTYNLDVNIKVKNSRKKVRNFLNGLESDEEDKGESNANGTVFTGKAYVNGKRGRISAGYSANSLVGELGAEMRVRDGKYEILGQNGAEFTDVRPDDIIFNAEQTKEILKKGKVNSRGNAYNTGVNGGGGTFESHTTSKKKKDEEEKKKKDKKKDKSSDTTKFQQAIDWCTQSINRLTSLIENVNAKIALTSKSLGKQLKYYKELISKQQKLIKGYEKSEDVYKKAYNKALNKLSEKDRKKVKDGTYTIENLKGKAKSGKTSEAEKRYNNIQSALEARDTYLKAQTDLVNAKQQLNEYIETLAGIRWEKASESIEKINKKIEVLDAKASNLNGYKSKNTNIDEKVKAQYKTVKEQQSAVNKTQSDKDAIDKKALNIKGKINSKYKTSKRTNANGTLSEDGVSGKQLNLIRQYNLQIKKSNAYKKKLSEINQELAVSEQEYITLMNESIATKANNIQQDYENRMSLIDAKENQLNAEIALAEAKGQVASAKYYQLLNQNSKQRISELKSEKKALENQLKGLSEYSDAWYEVKSILISVDEQLAEETQNAVENITKQIEAVSDLTEAINNNLELHTDSDFYTSLTEGEDYYEKNGMTDIGKSVLAAKYLEYTGKQQQRENLDKELEVINRKAVEGTITKSQRTQLIDEWLKKAQDLDKEIISSQNAIGDMLTESYKAQLDGLKEIIDAKKKALSLDKSEYDYQESIAEKTKSIATLQKQLAMLEGRNDEEANAERQKIQLQLEDAQEDLDDTQYDKYIERVENALDDLSERFSDTIDELSKTLNHVGAIESNIYDLISDDKGSIFEAVRNVFDDRGINLNDSGDWLSYMQSLAGNKDKKEDTFGTGIVSERLDQQTDYLEKIYEKIPDEKETGKEKTKLSVADVLGKASEKNKKTDTSEMSALNKYLVKQGYKPMSTSKMADLASALRSSPAFDNLDAKTKETISSITSASQLDSKKDMNAGANKNALLKALKYIMAQEFLNSHLKEGIAGKNYGALNKYLYQTQDDKVLSKEDAVTLGKILGVSDANKNGMIDGKEGNEIVKKLIQIGFPLDGIVEGIDSLEIPQTLPQTELIKKFAESFDMEKFKEYAKSIDFVTPALDNLREMQLQAIQTPMPDLKPVNSTTIGDVHMTFELPNVIDPQSFIKTIQNNSQVQKTLQNVTVGQLNGNMKFRGNRL